MPKVRLLAPAANPKDGSPLAAGAEVDVDDDTFASWRASGLATSLDDEKAAEQAAKTGNYGERTTRPDTGGEPPAEKPPEKPPEKKARP